MLCEKEQCTGCTACMAACPKDAIKMEADEEGFLRPVIDPKACIQCGKCEMTCPFMKEKDFQKGTQQAFAIMLNDEKLREESSSGGAFSIIAESILEDGGVVFGAAYDENFHVRHIAVKNSADLSKLRGSKYVQSEVGDSLRQVKEYLNEGRKVLYGGTPCQVAGLRSFLGREYERLFTYDLICHGTPSPAVFEGYLRYVEKKTGKRIRSYNFRYKKPGWKVFSTQIVFADGTQYSKTLHGDPYFLGFMGNYFLRPSCHLCGFADTRRVSDITIADFWGIEKNRIDIEDDDKGLSLILVNTEKGKQLLEQSHVNYTLREATIEEAAKEQYCLKQNFPAAPNRNAFWQDYAQLGLETVVEKYLMCEENKELFVKPVDLKNLSTIIIPSDGVGSKGDEAMLRGLLNLVKGTGEITVWNPREEHWQEWLVDRAGEFVEKTVPLEQMAQEIKEPCRLLLIGADIMDGNYGVENTMYRLNAIRKNLNLGGTAEIFSCSFRSESPVEIREKMINLGERAVFYLRDKESLKNFEEQIGRKGIYFPDLAFQCENIESDRSRTLCKMLTKEKNNGRLIIGLNLCEHAFRSFYKEISEANRREYVKRMIEAVLEHTPDAFLVFIPHDIREWDDNLADIRYAKMAGEFMEAAGGGDRYCVCDEFMSEAELLSVLSLFDIVISGRMHLNIATIRRGAIPVAFFGNSGEFKNVEKFRGMFRECVGRDDFVTENLQELSEALEKIVGDLLNIRGETADHFAAFERKTEECIRKYKETEKPDSDVKTQSVLEQMPRLFTEKNNKIRYWKKKCDDLVADWEAERADWEAERADWEEERRALEQEILNKEGHIELLLPAERELLAIRASKMFRIVRVACRVLDIILYIPKQIAKKLFAFGKMMGHVNPAELKIAWGYVCEEGIAGAYRHLMRDYHQGELKKIQVDVEKKVYEEITDLSVCEPLHLPKTDQPLVSIVVPAYNQFTYTYYCIKSIIENSGEIPYEVILADDCSNDLTTRISEVVENLVIARTEGNLRFLRNCNQAAAYAKGDYILFLNNDTQVQKNWLQPLLDLIQNDDAIGMVGSKLVYADGTLQEAGGIIWRDGTGWNYGRNDDAMKPEYNYVKEVDYISGAAIMIRRELWEKLGGFDDALAPAYYEDTDLAFQVRAGGYKVVYQPLSVVVHFEGKSNGTDLNSGIKKYQEENRTKFQEKWRTVLRKEQKLLGHDVYLAKDRSQLKKRILVVDHYVPHYDKDAGGRCTYMYLKLFLKLGFKVTFIGDNFYQHEPYTTELTQLGIEILYGDYYCIHWQEWLKENLHYFDYVYLQRPHISIKYIDLVKQYARGKVFYFAHDLHYLRLTREYELKKDPAILDEAEKFKKDEFYLFDKADVIHVVGSYEQAVLQKELPEKKIRNIPLYIYENLLEDINKDFSSRNDILFVGGFGHSPNIDAVLWFAREIFPEILKAYPDMVWHIVGGGAPKEVTDLANEHIRLEGFLSDEELEKMYRTCRLAVVPLRVGAGVKGKVVEAAYYQIPLVTTSIGEEGISNAEGAFVAEDNAQEMAQLIVELYGDFEKLREMSDAGKDLIRNHYMLDEAERVLKLDL